MIVNIRGTNGSGKSSVIKHIIKQYPDNRIIKKYRSYLPEPNYMFLGNYFDRKTGELAGNTGCGFDQLRIAEQKELVYKACEHLSNKATIFFEGFVVSGIHSSWRDVFEQVKHKHDIVIVHLHFPIETHFERVCKRREKDFLSDKTKKNIIGKYKGTESAINKFKNDGYNVLEIEDPNKSIAAIAEEIKRYVMDIRGV